MNTRTYTAHTCALIVSSQDQQESSDRHPVDFTLHLDDPDRGELDRVTLQGNYQQLDHLQQIVSKYISELVASFPLPNPDNHIASAPDRSPQIDLGDPATTSQSDPNLDTQSGIFKNLPGLRDRPLKSPPTSKGDNRRNAAAKPSIAKLLNPWNKSSNDRDSHRDDTVGAAAPLEPRVKPAASETAPTAPYLSGVSDAPLANSHRSLNRQLYLGNLATTASGEVLSLSVIQIFDLSTVLDEYAAEQITTNRQVQSATLSRANIPDRDTQGADFGSTTTSLSRLPNLPRIPVESQISQVYYRTRRSRSSFMSGIPWAIAAAIAVGVPLLLLDPNPNPFKDAANQLKIPGLAGTKKSATAKLPTAKTPKPSSNTSLASSPNPSSPTPWQTQPVQPPQVATTEDPSKIGIAPLPDAIVSNPEQETTTAGSQGKNVKSGGSSGVLNKSGIAPNPLNSSQSPSDLNQIDNTTGSAPKTSTPKVGTKPGTIAPTKNRPISAPAKVAPSKTTTTQIGQLPIDPIQTGKVSVSQQPILMPPADLAPAINPPSSPQMPLNPDTGIDPTTVKPQTPKVKPTPAASKPNPKTVQPTGTEPTPSSDPEPFTPVVKNPNLINPNPEPTSQNSPEPQASPAQVSPAQVSPVVPDRPLQSNNGTTNGNAEPTENPLLQETKRYFQSKWKADPTQTNSLQYVVQVSGKSGIVRSVLPQGEAAITYLQQTKFIKSGQKLISPAAAGTSDQKIRVVLQPDGNVDTFIEP
jgi:Domain of unknown function (DUF4335)